jgi:hypothetical protein
MDGKYILVNDVGTTGTRAVLFDRETNIVSEVYREIPQIFPQPGWTEQDPVVLYESCVDVTRKALREAGASPEDIAAMGIATQRATSMIWDAETGEPVYNAITWQDTRMSDTCERINRSPLFRFLHLLGNIYQRIAVLGEGLRRNRLGKLLITAAHFTVTPAQSSAHARWILDNVEGAAAGERRAARAGTIAIRHVTSVDAESVDGLLDDLAAIERRSWLFSRGGHARFATPDGRALWRSLILRSLVPHGQLDCWLMYLDGRPASFVFGMTAGTVRYVIANNYDEAVKTHRTGSILYRHMMEDGINRGVRLFDFGDCNLHYKRLWGASYQDYLDSTFVAPRSLVGAGAMTALALRDLARLLGRRVDFRTSSAVEEGSNEEAEKLTSAA